MLEDNHSINIYAAINLGIMYKTTKLKKSLLYLVSFFLTIIYTCKLVKDRKQWTSQIAKPSNTNGVNDIKGNIWSKDDC